MNKKLKGILFVLVGIILVYFLINRDTIKDSEISYIVLINGIINFLRLIFGNMLWFVSFFLIFLGFFNIYLKNIKLKYHKIKIFSLILWFISWSILLIQKYIPLELPKDFFEAGRNILEIGFNKESGGVIGGILSLPFYKIIHFPIFGVILKVINLICIITIFREFIILAWLIVVSIIKYYRSDEYKKKKKLLRAKKIQEKQEYINAQKRKTEELKEKVLESRKQRISFELSRKPKEHFLQKTETYSEIELIDKEKEWIKIIEESNEEIEKIKRKIDTLEEKNEKFEKDKDSEITEIKKIIEKHEKTEQEKKEIETKGDKLKENGISQGRVEKVLEEVVNNKEVEKLLDEKVKVQNEEEEHIEEKEIEIDKYKNSMENENDFEENDESLKNSIEEIFLSKPMDENKRKEIEIGIRENISHLEEVLKEFGVSAKVVNYEYGPTITRYEITIPKGVRVNKVSSLQDDIQLSLAAKSVRIEAPIPGKNTIGIEVPNKVKEPVHFSNLIRNPKLDEGALNIILGKNIVGQDKIIDIAKMPHLLIAGQTGSGKSVAVNTLISTLISKKSEKEVRFIMVDPKMVELMPYNGIPHLLVPVIIDPQQAAIALKWAVNEMENRYRQLMENGVRNIIGYNSLGYVDKMPYIVIIIDELADLMMVASGSVEESIARIAQKARAVGIHLVVATQRPSTDVITGMIKANLPSRISFSLRSQIDSRTILDSPGAEKLLGQGDMLLLENGSSNAERIQGAWISDEEVIKLTTALKENKKVQYMEEILIDKDEGKRDLDPFFDNAIDVIKQEGKVSISLLQRKLNVGFNRASRIYEQLKDNGIINSDNEILIDEFE